MIFVPLLAHLVSRGFNSAIRITVTCESSKSTTSETRWHFDIPQLNSDNRDRFDFAVDITGAFASSSGGTVSFRPNT
jgi:hypothetical protein